MNQTRESIARAMAQKPLRSWLVAGAYIALVNLLVPLTGLSGYMVVAACLLAFPLAVMFVRVIGAIIQPSICPEFLSKPGLLLRMKEGLGAKQHVLRGANEWRSSSCGRVEQMQKSLSIPDGLAAAMSGAEKADYSAHCDDVLQRLDQLRESLLLMDPCFEQSVEDSEAVACEEALRESKNSKRAQDMVLPFDLIFEAQSQRDLVSSRDEGGAEGLRRRFIDIEDELDLVEHDFVSAHLWTKALVVSLRERTMKSSTCD